MGVYFWQRTFRTSKGWSYRKQTYFDPNIGRDYVFYKSWNQYHACICSGPLLNKIEDLHTEAMRCIKDTINDELDKNDDVDIANGKLPKVIGVEDKAKGVFGRREDIYLSKKFVEELEALIFKVTVLGLKPKETE